jgi:RND family efflux transporter MFP subunit
MRQSIRSHVLVALLPLVGCMAAGCQPAPEVVSEPPPVEVSQPEEREITDFLEFQGRTSSVQKVEVRPQITGSLQNLYFKEGTEVIGIEQMPLFVAAAVGAMNPLCNPGLVPMVLKINPVRPYGADLLYQIDPVLSFAAMEKAQADVQTLTATVELRQVAYEIILRSKAGASELDRQKAEGDLKMAQAQLLGAQANLTKAQKELSFCWIFAPQSGKIGDFKVTKGNIVNANQTLLTDIVGVDPMWVDFDVDDSTMLNIQQMVRDGVIKAAQHSIIPLKMELTTDKGPLTFDGVIDFVDNQVKRGTGTIAVRARFPNPIDKDRNRMLTPGLFCKVRINLGSPQKRWVVAERCLMLNQGQRYVFVVNAGNEVVYRPVKVGRLDDGLRVILEGVGKEDRVIVNGMQGVRPGMKCQPTSVAMPRVVDRSENKDGNRVGMQKKV